MLRGLALVCALLVGVPAGAQTPDAGYLPMCREGPFDLCGYRERDTGEHVIAPRFERALPFSEGLAGVRIEGRFGFIDTSGAVVIAPQFDLVSPFTRGLAEVLIDGQIGLIDRSGAMVVPPQFGRAMPLTDKVVIATPGEWRSVHYQGMERLDPLGVLSGRGRAGLYHIEDGWLTDTIYTFKFFGADGLVWATTDHYLKGPFGLMRSDGSWQVEPFFTHVQGIHDGRAVVRGGEGDGWGAVDETGTVVIALEWPWLGFWQSGYGATRLDGMDGPKGLVDLNGDLVGGQYFDDIERLGRDRFRVSIDGQWFGMALDGSLSDDPFDGVVQWECPDGIIARQRGQTLELSHPGLAEPVFSDLAQYGRAADRCEQAVAVRLNGFYTLLTQEGRQVGTSHWIENLSARGDGLVAVSIGGKWGLMDMQDDLVVTPQFDDIRFIAGAFRVMVGERVFWIDGTGVEVPEPADAAPDPSVILDCRAGLELFAQDGLWGMRWVETGEVLIPPAYRALHCYRDGVAFAAVVGAAEWCPIGPDGTRRDYPACRVTSYPMQWSHHYPERFADTPFESSVLWVRAYLDFGRGARDMPPLFIGDGVQGHGSIPAFR